MTAVKHDNGKPRTDLLPPAALLEVAAVLAHGANRYGDHNWREGLTHSRTLGAALRHIYKFQDGATFDSEDEDCTNCHHLACAVAELLFALTFELQGRNELDDRYTVPAPVGLDDR